MKIVLERNIWEIMPICMEQMEQIYMASLTRRTYHILMVWWQNREYCELLPQKHECMFCILYITYQLRLGITQSNTIIELPTISAPGNTHYIIYYSKHSESQHRLHKSLQCYDNWVFVLTGESSDMTLVWLRVWQVEGCQTLLYMYWSHTDWHSGSQEVCEK